MLCLGELHWICASFSIFSWTLSFGGGVVTLGGIWVSYLLPILGQVVVKFENAGAGALPKTSLEKYFACERD